MSVGCFVVVAIIFGVFIFGTEHAGGKHKARRGLYSILCRSVIAVVFLVVVVVVVLAVEHDQESA